MLSRRGLLVSAGILAAAGAGGYALWPRLDDYEAAIARQRETLSAEPALSDLVRYATLAANGHNTQPWRFRLDGRQVSILPDLSRRTEVVDPDDHHLYVSLGCAAENLLIAAGAHGMPGALQVSRAGETSIDIDLGAGPSRAGSLYDAIPARQSTRSLYDGRPIAADHLKLLEAAVRQDGVSVRFFTDAGDLEKILEFVTAGNSAQMNDPAFIRELKDWLRFSPANAVARGDGLFAPCSGNPAMPEWIGGRMFDMVFTEAGENDKYAAHIRSSAGIAVFTGDKADHEHWIRVGRSFERFALQATALGIRNAHINQPIEVPEIRPQFAAWLGDADARPDLVVRFGYAPALPMSLRRPVDRIIA